MPDIEKVKVLYIAGAGRSGSTILNSLLGMHDNMFGAGEFFDTLRIYAEEPDWPCSCRARLDTCEFWNGIFEQWQKKSPIEVQEFLKLQRYYESYRFLFNPFKKQKLVSKDFQNYEICWNIMFDLVIKKSDKDWIIDSSKSIPRAYILSKMKFCEFRVIHLIRDVRSLIHSLSRADMHKRSAFRAIMFWNLIHVAAEIFLKDSLKISYEQFFSSPESCLNKIASFTGENMNKISDAVQKEQPIEFTHILSGNIIRMQNNLQLNCIAKWQRELSFSKKAMAIVLSFPLLLHYEYIGLK